MLLKRFRNTCTISAEASVYTSRLSSLGMINTDFGGRSFDCNNRRSVPNISLWSRMQVSVVVAEYRPSQVRRSRPRNLTFLQ
jgi:hypothetical protein